MYFLTYKLKWSESCSVVSNCLQPHRLDSPWNPPDQNTGVGSLSLSPGDLLNPGIESRSPTPQELNPGLPHSLPAEPQGKLKIRFPLIADLHTSSIQCIFKNKTPLKN